MTHDYVFKIDGIEFTMHGMNGRRSIEDCFLIFWHHIKRSYSGDVSPELEAVMRHSYYVAFATVLDEIASIDGYVPDGLLREWGDERMGEYKAYKASIEEKYT